MRKRYVALLFGLVVIASVLGASQAVGSGASSPSGTAIIQKLPVAALSDSDQASLNSSLTQGARSRFGITDQDARNVRVLARTAAGQFYVVSGDKGSCIIALGTISGGSCGIPTNPASSPLTLFIPDPSTGYLIGGGIATGNVVVSTVNGKAISVPTFDGLVRVTAAQHISVDTAPRIATDADADAETASSAEQSIVDNSLFSRTVMMAAGTQHCRRFAPSVLPVDTNCWNNGTMTAGSYYTPGPSHRDEAEIYVSSARSIRVWYPTTNISSQASGNYAWIYSSGTAYVKAACSMSQSNTTGQCSTVYHES